MATTAPFEFAFNGQNFSDKVLLLELEDEPDGLEELQLDEEQPQAKRNACNRQRRRKAGAESDIPVPEVILSKLSVHVQCKGHLILLLAVLCCIIMYLHAFSLDQHSADSVSLSG
jgi:hypothetical protein